MIDNSTIAGSARWLKLIQEEIVSAGYSFSMSRSNGRWHMWYGDSFFEEQIEATTWQDAAALTAHQLINDNPAHTIQDLSAKADGIWRQLLKFVDSRRAAKLAKHFAVIETSIAGKCGRAFELSLDGEGSEWIGRIYRRDQTFPPRPPRFEVAEIPGCYAKFQDSDPVRVLALASQAVSGTDGGRG